MPKAKYSSSGDIILEVQEETRLSLLRQTEVHWNILPETGKSTRRESSTQLVKKAQRIIMIPVEDCKVGLKELRHSIMSVHEAAQAGLFAAIQGFYKRLAEPVFLLHRKRAPQKTNRLRLFFSDTLRFGLTFSSVFAVLFVSLNYQSFWAIASDQFNPIASVQQREQLAKKITGVLTATESVPSGASTLLQKLPAVGPKEDMILIPALNLSAPIVTPEYEALLREDWSKLEKDIQAGLENGPIHYPGTAAAGQPGNFFITGHSSYYPWAAGKYKNVFAKLHLLNVGDEYYVYYKGNKHKYVITEKKEVQPNNVDVLDQPLDRKISTLMTCTPVGTTLRRLIVVASEVDLVTNQILTVESAAKNDKALTAKPSELPI
jgi:LPXTG-site transpeptidase (sortase) family protein